MSGGSIGKGSIINPSMVLLHTVSPFNLWCDFFAPEQKKDPEPESSKILAKIGNIEEANYVEEKYPGMQRVEVETVEQAFYEVLKGCFQGVEAFSQARLIYLPEGILGIPDVLEKETTHSSVFGSYHYVVKEKKITKTPKLKHILQTALNNYMLGKIQDYTPPRFVILNRDNTEVEFVFADYADQLQTSLAEIREIMNGKVVTPTTGALQEPWKSYGLEKAKEISDISLISGIGPAKKELLANAGIKTVVDLERANVAALKIKGIGPLSLTKWKIHATSIAQKRIITVKKPSLPKCDTEIFLDLEGTFDVSNLFLQDFGIESKEKWINVVYLIGVIVVENGRKEYTPYFADSIEKEKDILEQFISLLKSKTNFVVYHYGAYEKTKMRQLLAKYSIRDSFADKMVDLNQVLKNCAVFPTHGSGLKEIAKELGFSWSEQEMDGFISIAHYLNYLQNGDKGQIQKIIKYNEEDCKATTIVKDFLDSLSKEQ
jgi:uncharacterized protein